MVLESIASDDGDSRERARIFISYRSQSPDLELAETFFDALKADGHQPFLAGISMKIGQDWAARIQKELNACDYFLLLLSPDAANSEMVTEEVRTAKQLRETREGRKPSILPIRMNFPMDTELNYDLRGYLNRIQQSSWTSEKDTGRLIEEILAIVRSGKNPDELGEEDECDPDKRLEAQARSLQEGVNGRPRPVSEPEIPGGQMNVASEYYIEREPWETRSKQAIAQPAGLVRIKAPRQMGKTSLMARILHDAKEKDYQTATITFQLMSEDILQNSNQFFLKFCMLVSRALRLPKATLQSLREGWGDDVEMFGLLDACTAYFEDEILPSLNGPLVLGLDEVDKIFPYRQVAADFLSMLRAWHERSKNDEVWSLLKLVVVHSTESYIVLDANQSPFNVGLVIDLPEFSGENVTELADLHGLNWGTSQTQLLMDMIGGHPYSVRLALYHLAQEDITLDQLLEEAPTEAGLFSDHLRRHLWHLEKHSNLLEAVKKALIADKPVKLDAEEAFKLHGMGLMDLDGNAVSLRCNLYRQYFKQRLLGV